ncbi:MAG: hypothetical protein FWH37_08460 [Candidatus Bathyarchaeota archaeon]|nr:hypothetical protein [Candidatus Termiticorpusculum sp.]
MENSIKYSGRKFKITLLFLIIIAVSLFTTLWTLTTSYPPLPTRAAPPNNFGIGNGQIVIRSDFEIFYVAHSVVSTVNMVLLIALLVIFIEVYKKTKSEFSFGLIIFGFAFLLKDIASSPFLASIFSFYASGLGPFIVLPDMFELAALSVLLYLNLKY